MNKPKTLCFRLEEELAHEFKLVCVKIKKSQNEIIEEIIKEFVKGDNKAEP